MSVKLDAPILVNQRGLLLVRGIDCHKFLQGQVTCDIEKLSSEDGFGLTCLGAHCTPKGRVLFSFRAIELDKETIALALPVSLVDDAFQALKKYSLFFKTELIDARADYRCVLLHRRQLGDFKSKFSRLPDSDNAYVHVNDHALIRLSEDYFECWLPQHSVADYPQDNKNYWDAVAIELGLGEVRPQTVGMFIPQMLNLQAVAHGISFTKGCYTGQEVVARMQYLGKLKRRLYRLRSATTELLAPGSPLYTPDDQQAAGHVVLITTLSRDLLAVVAEKAIEANQIFAGSDHQHHLSALSLPYTMDPDSDDNRC